MALPSLSELQYRRRLGESLLPGAVLPADYGEAQADNQGPPPSILAPPTMPPPVLPSALDPNPPRDLMAANRQPPTQPNPKSPMLGTAKAFRTPPPPPAPSSPKVVLPPAPDVDSGPPTLPVAANAGMQPPPTLRRPMVGIDASQDETKAAAPDFDYNPQTFPKNGGAKTEEVTSPMDRYQQSQRPEPPKSKWYQKLAAAAAGGAAGYVNAAGRARIDPRSIAAAESGILAPGYAGKVENYEAQQQDLADKAGMSIKKEQVEGQKEARLANVAYREGQVSHMQAQEAQAADALAEKHQTALDKAKKDDEDRRLKAWDVYTQNGKLPTVFTDPNGASPGDGWRAIPFEHPLTGKKGWIPPAGGVVTPDLAEYGTAPAGTFVDRDELIRLNKSKNDYELALAKQDNSADNKEGVDYWIAKSNDPSLSDDVRATYKAKIADAIRVKNAEHPVTNVITNQQKATRADRSYEFNSKQLEGVGKTVQDASARMSRLQDTLAAGTPQADALVAPELLTVMAGGQGSGVRMTEAELSRVIGGRSHLENLKATLQKWSLDPKKANSITPEQRSQIRSLVAAVNEKLNRKRILLDQARQELINAEDETKHRTIVADLHQKLTDIDGGSGSVPGVGGGGQRLEQRSKTSGQYRYSLDGGATWQPGRLPAAQ